MLFLLLTNFFPVKLNNYFPLDYQTFLFPVIYSISGATAIYN